MNKHFTRTGFLLFFTILSGLTSSLNLSAQARDVNITIHLRGVYESGISLLALSPSQTFKPIFEVK